MGLRGSLLFPLYFFVFYFFPSDYYCYHQKKQNLNFFLRLYLVLLVSTYSICCPLSAGLCHCRYKNNASRVQSFVSLVFVFPRYELSEGIFVTWSSYFIFGAKHMVSVQYRVSPKITPTPKITPVTIVSQMGAFGTL